MSQIISWWSTPALAGAALATALLALVGAPAAALADELKIGYKSELTSADPHVLNGANRNVWNHVYESLVASDANLRPRPGLALSWRLVNPTTWEFRLRPGVKFHNGATMSAEDVKFSIERAMQLTGPRTYRSYLREVESVTITAPLVVQVKGRRISPTLPENLGLVAILPRSLGASLSEESFATGKSAIGTGPYRFVSWAHGQNIVLARNADYWGAKEPWERVTLQFIPREPARVAALLSGSVDIINDLPSKLAASLRDYRLQTVTSYMLNYLALDQQSENPAFVKANDGTSLGKNPLKDLKVRQAMASAINRECIIRFLMKGDATASAQLVPKGFFGHDPEYTSLPYDLKRAKALLAEAGYPQGFRLTMHCPNNRYINDAKLCEAIAQVFNQIGIKADVATMPFSVFQSRMAGAKSGAPEFSVSLLGSGAVTGDSASLLAAVVHSFNQAGGGANNYGRYSNKEVDALIDQAAATADDAQRLALQQKAARTALDDMAVLPLQHLNVSWAMKKTLSIAPRADGFTMATDIRKN